ncbi:MAG TPA: hypothetical protein VIK13_14810 [Candidatus Limnocylindrales bacterium]
MQTEGGDIARDAWALEGALDETLAELPGADRGASPDKVDYHWLSIGLRLGMERPGRSSRSTARSTPPALPRAVLPAT